MAEALDEESIWSTWEVGLQPAKAKGPEEHVRPMRCRFADSKAGNGSAGDESVTYTIRQAQSCEVVRRSSKRTLEIDS